MADLDRRMIIELMNHKPNLFIAGFPKCGTTSIYNYLKEHPQIYGPELKEPRFLVHEELHLENSHRIFREMTVTDEAEYLAMYQDGINAKYRMDGTPFYIKHPKAAHKIKEISDDSRVIISIRNPVDRFISAYKMIWNKGYVQTSLREYIDGRHKKQRDSMPSGIYYEYIAHMQSVMGKDRVLVIMLDELRDDINGTLGKIYDFLGIENIIPLNAGKSYYSNKNRLKPGLARNILTSKFAKFMYLKLPPKLRNKLKKAVKIESLYMEDEISDDIRQELLDYYMEDITKTEELTGYDLSEWKRI